jgi:hypothetical protein
LFEHDLFGKPVSTFPDHALNLDLGPELHDLLGRQAKERRRAFGVALQERKDIFAPSPRAGDVLARNDRT